MERSWVTLVVAQKRMETQDIASFELVHPDGGELLPFSAGAHIDVEPARGLVRQYSLCNHPAERNRYVIAVLRESKSRGGSVAMIDRVAQGDRIRISEPRNHFALVPEAKRALLFAGGIGVTPILCMAERLAHGGVPFVFHYANRSRARTAFLKHIERSGFADKVRWHFDDEAGGEVLDLKTALGAPDEGTHVYTCGPAGFIKAVLGTAERAGWPAAQLHREYFAPAVDTPAGEGGAFSVRIASTGRTFEIPAGRPVIDVLAEHGISIPVSCQQGVCGTCVTGVLEGVPEHHDMFMTDEEHARNDRFTPCCSRARTALLVLEL
jgi:vanillate O-demethylase ferredoxin subunit